MKHLSETTETTIGPLARMPRRVLAPAALAVAALAAAPVAQAQQAGTIVDAVENELLYDAWVEPMNITITAENGEVTLDGTVDTLLAKRRAEDLAETVRGVTEVDNHLDVLHEEMSDGAVSSSVEEALALNPATESYEIDVTVAGSVVTLDGQVQSWAERSIAETVAAGVEGVAAVVNNLDVATPEARGDAEIEREIEEAFFWDTKVPAAAITVAVEDGIATLTGSVGSLAVKSHAVNLAYVAGVLDVNAEGLYVEPDVDVAVITDAVTDPETAAAIRARLETEALVDDEAIDVSVNDGVASLRGELPNLDQVRTAASVAENTYGVSEVNNRLKVAGTDASDAELERAAEDALLVDAWVNSLETEVEVIDDEAILTGTVDSYAEKAATEDVIASVRGIRAIDNNLAVLDTGDPLVYDAYVDDAATSTYVWYDYEPDLPLETDTTILENIKDEMFWSPFVDSDEVTVLVDDGEATLTGEVDSFDEADAAVENAYEGGAVWVDNDLVVDLAVA